MSGLGTSRRTTGPSSLRRFFDKVMKDGKATFDPRKDGSRFLRAACTEFADDPVDLLYRLNKPQVSRATVHSRTKLQIQR